MTAIFPDYDALLENGQRKWESNTTRRASVMQSINFDLHEKRSQTQWQN